MTLDDGKKQLVTDNLNLVGYVIRKNFRGYWKDEDIRQAGMEGLCKAAEQWEGIGNFSPFACNGIRWEIMREIRKRKSLPPEISLSSQVGDEMELQDVLVADVPEDSMLNLQLLDAMTEAEKEVFFLLSDGYNTEDVSSVLGKEPNTIRRHIRMLKKKILQGRE